jgi:2-(3-amino-3-carboxypropyl)histidine synthase
MGDSAVPSPEAVNEKQPRKIISRRRRNKNKGPTVDQILLEKTMVASSLPQAYSFEVAKSVDRILQLQASHVALQMPEGLLLYATVLSDVMKRLAPCLITVSILGDVTYGACCVDDLGAKALGAQLLIHYGHSCLVQLQHTAIPCLYVFVEITIDVPHLVECLDMTLQQRQQESQQLAGGEELTSNQPLIYLLGTIQFRHALTEAQTMLEDRGYSINIPQAKPLSPGEVLGCTSPVLTSQHDSAAVTTNPSNDDADRPPENAIVCFVADGRFHLESTLISNPHIPLFLRYDPYGKALTEESYLHDKMKSIRYDAIQQARKAQTFGILLGTLGRQGNPAIVSKIQQTLRKHQKRSFVLLVSEITPQKLALFSKVVQAWVQVACPRLSVDWGHCLSQTQPVLNPYELHVCLDETKWRKVYPMDYYSNEGGPWSNYHEETKDRQYKVLS